MKKIIFSLAVIAIVAVGAIGATRAYFSDTESSTENTFTAGKLDLELGTPVSIPFDVTDVVPGQSGTGKITLTNVAGSIDGKLNINLVNVLQPENGILEPEQGLNGEYTPDTGELGMFLNFVAFIDVDKNGSFNNGDIQLAYNGVLPYSQINYFAGWKVNQITNWSDIMTMTPGQSVDLIINWEFPSQSQDSNYSQNIAMGDGLSFDIQTSLEQVHP